MNLSAGCFNDEELRGFIASNGKDGVCDVLGIKGNVVDINDLSEFLTDLLSIFDFDASSNMSLADIINRDWKLFPNRDIALSILSEAVRLYKPTLNTNHVSYIKPISDYVNIWYMLKHDLQYKTRYFINLQNYNPTDPYLNECLKVDDFLHTGERLYRARVLPDLVSNYGIDEMGCPPKEIVGGGRANPIGIPYLYLCGDKDTTFYEVRARYKDRVSVGTFEVMEDMNLINLTNKTSLYLSSTAGDFHNDVKHKLLLNAVAKDMSKPLSRYDTELEYVPTQFICELCRINGADGICFSSSLHHIGMNYVLFCGNDDSKIKCSSVETLTIEHVEIRA